MARCRRTELVPGDLVAVERGDVIPADAVIVDGRGESDESSLTGESLPVQKQPDDEIYSGAVLVRGGPVARVLATGSATVFGRTAELAGKEPPPSHFQQAVISIGKYLIVLALALVAIIVVVSLLRGASLADTLEFALVVTIASVPVALPAVLSVTMAVGARHLAQHEAVVSHLPAVEEMAGVDVLCADKTGTITKNELAVAEVVVLGEDVSRDEVLLEAALTSEPGSGDPIDRAILERVDPQKLQAYEVLDLEPFDPTRKRAEAKVRDADGGQSRVAKGATQAIFDLAGGGDGLADQLAEATAGSLRRATGRWRWRRLPRTAQLAHQRPAWPPGPAARRLTDTLAQARRWGRVKMVTGDRVEIAREIATMVGMDRNILEAGALHSDDEERGCGAGAAGGGGRRFRPGGSGGQIPHRPVAPGTWPHRRHDRRRRERRARAGACRAGIAVSGATDAARAAADIVLLAPGLSTIIEAIHRAREVFQRMKSYAIYRITETIRVVLFVTIAILLFDFFPVTPIQVVLLAILNDGAILSIAYDRVRGSSRPVRWNLTEVLTIATVLGGVGLVSTFGLLWLAHGPLALTDATIQTLVYLKLSVAGHLTVFVARTHGRLWSYRPSWILIGAVIGTQIVATLIAISGLLMAPIAVGLAAFAWGYAIVWALVLDQAKVIAYGVLERRGAAAEELAEA